MKQPKTVVLPSDFTIDDVAALHCFLQANKYGLDDVEVRFYTHEMLSQIFGDDVYLIDCGENDYKERSAGCAAVVVCSDFEIKPDEALEKLIEVLTRNNQTGFLRQHSFSLSFAIRYTQWIKKDSLLVLQKALEVIDIYLRLKRTKTKEFGAEEAKTMILESRTLKAVNDEMQAFLVEYRGGEREMKCHVFTLPWYIAARMILGDRISDIRDNARFWFRMFLAIEKVRKEAKESLEGKKCFVEVGGDYWFVAETNNPFITEFVFRYCAVAIVRNPITGSVAILTNRQMRFDVSKVANILNRREKGFWYCNDRIQAVLNGSTRRPRPPTKLSVVEIFNIVKENIQ